MDRYSATGGNADERAIYGWTVAAIVIAALLAIGL